MARFDTMLFGYLISLLLLPFLGLVVFALRKDAAMKAMKYSDTIAPCHSHGTRHARKCTALVSALEMAKSSDTTALEEYIDNVEYGELQKLLASMGVLYSVYAAELISQKMSKVDPRKRST